MTDQKALIHNSEWDVLIVIDACRYDYFARYYKGIFDNGNLIKAISPSEWSFGWIYEVFGDKLYDDIVFLKNWVAGYVLSEDEKDYKPEKLVDIIKRLGYQKYITQKFFGKVIKMQAEEEYANLHPKIVDKFAQEAIESYSNKRIIVSYRQIHEPYIYWIDKEKDYDVEQKLWRNDRFTKVYRFIYLNLIQYVINSERMWTIKDKLGMQPNGPTGKTWLKHGWDGVRLGYSEDLKLVLKHIKGLIKKYPNKKFIVTSDHGEFLGEHGQYGHFTNRRHKEVVEVPWFIV